MGKIRTWEDICRIAKRGLLPALFAATIALCATTAWAQTSVPVQDPFSVKVGALFPTNSSATDNSGNTDLSVGLDYAFAKTEQNNPALPSVYFDYDGGSKNGGHVDTYALGVAVRAYANTPSGKNKQSVSPYIGAGIGAYMTQIKNTRNAVVESGNNTGFGGKVFAGLEFSGNYFIEANYQFVPSNEGVNPSGVGVQLGARF